MNDSAKVIPLRSPSGGEPQAPVDVAHAAYLRVTRGIAKSDPVPPMIPFVHLAGASGDMLLDFVVVRLMEEGDHGLPLHARYHRAAEDLRVAIGQLQAAYSALRSEAEFHANPTLPFAA